jgi:hypothetical protein
VRQQFNQLTRFGTDYHDGDFSGVEILLVLNAAIKSQKSLESRFFSQGQ